MIYSVKQNLFKPAVSCAGQAGRFLYEKYACARLFFRALYSMGNGATTNLVHERVRALKNFRTAIENAGDLRAEIAYCFNEAAFSECRKVLFIADAKFLEGFVLAEEPQERLRMAGIVARECQRAILLQKRLKRLNHFYVFLCNRMGKVLAPSQTISYPSFAALTQGSNAGDKTPLQAACTRNDFVTVRFLLNQSVFLDGQTENQALNRHILNWMDMLKLSRDYKCDVMRPVLIRRVLSIILLATEHSEYRDFFSGMLVDASDACPDRAALVLNRLEVKKRLCQCPHYFSAEGLRLFRGCIAMDCLELISRETIGVFRSRHPRRRIDEVEVFLNYQIRLKEILDLPIECNEMNFRSIVTNADRDDAARQVLDVLNNPERLAEALVAMGHWTQKLDDHPDFAQEKEQAEAVRQSSLKGFEARLAANAARQEDLDELLFPDQGPPISGQEYKCRSQEILKERSAIEKERDYHASTWHREKTLQILRQIEAG